MTESDKVDHWASLAGNLGAEPAPEEPKQPVPAETPEAAAEAQAVESEPAVPPPPPPAFRPAAKPVPVQRRPARPSAWDQLPGELGIDVPPPPPRVETLPAASVKPPRAPLVAAPLAAESPRIVEPPKIVEPLEIALEAEVPLPSWDDLESAATQPESFEPQEALDIMDETADEFGEFGDESSDESVAPTEGAGELSAGEEIAKDERRSRRRRRRRGRGRGREDAPSAEGQTSDVAGEESTSDQLASDQLASDQLASDEPASEELVVSESLEVDSDGATQEPVEESRSDEERSERRGRRRRRGRGRDRDQVRDEATSGEEIEIEDEDADFDGPEDDEAEEVVGAEAATEAGDEPDFDDVDGNDDDGDEEGGESPRIGFRNIPTWQDAIGVMIAKNMESRSRNPGGPRGSGGRGGRGRGRRPDRR